MALIKRNRRLRRLVLDIGTSAIRVCELQPTKTGYQLTKYFQRELNIDPSMEEEAKLERKQDVLNSLLKEAKIRTKKTILAVPGQSVFTRNRPLPPVPEHKVTQIVKYEIQQQIPFSLDQIALDYQVLDRTEAGGYEVMMAAIKVDVVDKQLDVLEKTKRTIDVVDVSPLAAYNWLHHTGEFGQDGQCVALLDMGATTTDIVVQRDNQFRFTRSLHVGGNDVTTAISSAFNMSFDEAERLKRERAFAPTGDPKRDGKGGEVVGRVLGRLVGEINRSFAYFRSQPGGGPVNRVIVTGGGACLRNIIPYLQRQLGIEVRIAQPLAGLAVAPGAHVASEHPEQSCVVLGLALRCCETVPIQVNLIPPRVLEAARRKEQAFYWFLSLATLFLIMASIIPVTAAKVDLTERRIRQLERTLAQYDPALVNDPEEQSEFQDQLQIIRGDVDGYKAEVTKLDNVRKNSHFWLPVFREINLARPRAGGIVFTSIETAVIGGPGNTGEAARQAAEAAKNGAAAAPPEEEEASESAAAPQSAMGTRPAAQAGGGGGIDLGGGGMGAAFGRGSSTEQRVTGFPGLGARGGGALNIGGGFGGGGPGRGNSSRQPQNTIVEPNGVVIFGYASDIEDVRDFVDSLRQSDMFIDEGEDKGVYWHIAYSDEVTEADLLAAQGTLGSSRSREQSEERDSEGGLGSGLGGLTFNLSQGPRGRTPTNATPEMQNRSAYTFRIDLQFLGNPTPIPK